MVTSLVGDTLHGNHVFVVGNSNDPTSGRAHSRVAATVERCNGKVAFSAQRKSSLAKWRNHPVSRLSASDMVSMSDTELYELLYTHLYDNMRAVAWFVLGSDEAEVIVEDVIGNAWLRAWKYLPRWRAQTITNNDEQVRANAGHYLRGWLSQICSSQAYDHLRRRQLETRYILSYDQHDEHIVDVIDKEYLERHDDNNILIDKVTLSEVNDALMKLSERQRYVIGMTVAGLSQDEIAEQMGTTREAVKAILCRARKHLRKLYEYEG